MMVCKMAKVWRSWDTFKKYVENVKALEHIEIHFIGLFQWSDSYEFSCYVMIYSICVFVGPRPNVPVHWSWNNRWWKIGQSQQFTKGLEQDYLLTIKTRMFGSFHRRTFEFVVSMGKGKLLVCRPRGLLFLTFDKFTATQAWATSLVIHIMHKSGHINL